MLFSLLFQGTKYISLLDAVGHAQHAPDPPYQAKFLGKLQVAGCQAKQDQSCSMFKASCKLQVARQVADSVHHCSLYK